MRWERGDATVESVLLVPVVFLVVLVSVQIAVLFHAHNVATAAAAHGAAAAAAYGAHVLEGERAATVTVAELGGSLKSAPLVVTSARAVEVRVVIGVPQIVPGFPTAVTRSAVEEREVIVTEPER